VTAVMPLLSFRTETLEAQLPRFLATVESWQLPCDPAHILRRSPELLQVRRQKGWQGTSPESSRNHHRSRPATRRTF